MKLKAAISDYCYENVDIEKKIMEQNGIELVVIQSYDEDALIAGCRDVDGILNQYAQLTGRIINSLEKCKIITRYGIGYDNIDVNAATGRGIVVTNVPVYALEEVAEHAIALLMALARKVVPLDISVKNKIWDYKIAKPAYMITGKTLGLVGFGNIARNVARRAYGLGLHMLAYDPYIEKQEMDNFSVRKVDLDELLRKSDFVSTHVPLMTSTRHMIGKREFELMKSSAYLINVSRGPVIDEKSLFEALVDKKIAGAALDVLEKEPVEPDNPLLKLENVILSPHAAWYTEESEIKLRTIAATDVARVITGQRPENPVNPEVLK